LIATKYEEIYPPTVKEFIAGEGLLVHNTAEIAFGDFNSEEFMDLKDYSKVNQLACEMPKYKAPQTIDEGMERLKHLREVAKKNYSKEKEEAVLKSVVQ
jgi:hypothetical protein